MSVRYFDLNFACLSYVPVVCMLHDHDGHVWKIWKGGVWGGGVGFEEQRWPRLTYASCMIFVAVLPLHFLSVSPPAIDAHSKALCFLLALNTTRPLFTRNLLAQFSLLP